MWNYKLLFLIHSHRKITLSTLIIIGKIIFIVADITR